MATDSQFEQKLFKVLGLALEDATFADELMTSPNDAIKRKGLFLSESDIGAAQQFVKEMLVTKEVTSAGGTNEFTRAVFAPGGKRPGGNVATHGDVHGDGHGDVSVGRVAQLDALRLQNLKIITRKTT